MTYETEVTPVEGPFERQVRPLSPEAAELLNELVQRDPLLRKAFEQCCELKWNCQRGPFGCACGRRIR